MQWSKLSSPIIAATGVAGGRKGRKSMHCHVKRPVLKHAFAIASGAAMTFAMSYASAEGAQPTLEGVWRVTRTPINCATGEQVRPSFPAIMSFSKDGIYTGYGLPAGSTPAAGSPEYGTWKRDPGAQNYSFRFLDLNYDDSGAFDGTTEVAGTLQVAHGGDGFTYNATVGFFDANGNPLFTACGKATATRFE
jgi:hypothetical protein